MARRIDPEKKEAAELSMVGGIRFRDPKRKVTWVPRSNANQVEEYLSMGYTIEHKREGGPVVGLSDDLPDGAEITRNGLVMMSIDKAKYSDILKRGYRMINGNPSGGQDRADEVASAMKQGKGQMNPLRGFENENRGANGPLVQATGYDPDKDEVRKDFVSYGGSLHG